MAKHYTIKDLADATGHSATNICWAISVGFIPSPDIIGLKRKFFSGKQFHTAKKALTCRTKHSAYTKDTLYTRSDISRLTGLRIETIKNLLQMGAIPACDAYRGKRQVWKPEIIDQIRVAIDEIKRKPKALHLPDGYYTTNMAAKALGCPRITLQSWFANGTVAKPNTFIDGYMHAVFTDQDLARIREIKKGYFA